MVPILFNIDFIPRSFPKFWQLVLGKSSGISNLRVHRVSASLDFFIITSGPSPHFLLRTSPIEVSADVLNSICSYHRGTPWLLWHFLVFQTLILLPTFSHKLILCRSQSYFPPLTCIFGFLGIPYQLVCLKVLPISLKHFSNYCHFHVRI